MRRYATPPSLLPSYVRVFFTRKPAFIADGQSVPHLEVIVDRLEADARRLAAYRRVCGVPESSALPLAYPQVLAGPAQIALLSSSPFPARVMGIVHLRNRIEQLRPLSTTARFQARVWISGHLETERGQELELHTQLREGEEAVWSQTITLLLRRPVRPGTRMDRPPRSAHTPYDHSIDMEAPADIGRQFARVSGDYNPIHLTAASARLFGFPRAIAHGMWSLARCAALLRAHDTSGSVVMSVEFRSPILLPASLRLAHVREPGLASFALHDRKRARTYLTGSLTLSA